MSRKMNRRDFSRLAAVGAVAAPLTGLASAQSPKAGKESSATAEQESKVREAESKRNKALEPLRGHTLAYGLEPAFTFHPRIPVRRATATASKGAKG